MNVPVKIALIGATGKVGKPLLKQLLDRGYLVKSLIRKPQSYSVTHPSLEIIAGDVKDLETVIELVKGCDAVISVIGQRKDEPLISSLAASNLIHAMGREQISRYIFLTGLTQDMPGDQKGPASQKGTVWMKQQFPIVVADKEKAVELLQESNIDWTIVRLPWIEETEEKKKLLVDLRDCPGEKVSTTGLAAFLIEQIRDPAFIRKAPFVASV